MEICFAKLDMKMIRSFCKKKVMRYAVILQKALPRTYKRYRGVSCGRYYPERCSYNSWKNTFRIYYQFICLLNISITWFVLNYLSQDWILIRCFEGSRIDDFQPWLCVLEVVGWNSGSDVWFTSAFFLDIWEQLRWAMGTLLRKYTNYSSRRYNAT